MEKGVREPLNKLDMEKSMGPDRMHHGAQGARQLADVFVEPLSMAGSQ